MALRVLIVDDSKSVRRHIKSLLEASGCRVITEAPNGLEAINQYVRYKPDFVTLDLVMPILDGLSALEEIRKYDPHAKVMVITSSLSKKIQAQAEELGVEIFVIKPVTLEKIQAALHQLNSPKKVGQYG
ncbi:MAG: response regulator [Proteobacteria bacterium]|nr:response regulator [Pseudomonadota bacterium]NDC26134.1 response regulator [Pseudomonadota bacterium]NDD04475.1 response regulator [Pseudomonadota bacterium]